MAKLPQIPPPPQNADSRSQRWYESITASVKSALEQLAGLSSTTAAQGTALGKIQTAISDTVAAVGALQNPTGASEVPPALTGLTTNGAMTTIILTWTAPAYAYYGYTEVWRSATNNLGTAEMVGTTRSTIYADSVGTGADFFYWVRAVSTYGVDGPFNQSAGTEGKTALDPAYVMQVLTSQKWMATTVYEPFQYVIPSTPNGHMYLCLDGGESGATEPTWPTTADDTVTDGTVTWECVAATNTVPFTIGTVGGQPAVAIQNAYIQDGAITVAQIENAFIDNLVAAQGTIALANIAQGNIFDLTVDDIIQSSDYSPFVSPSDPGAGWMINKDGTAQFNNATISGSEVVNGSLVASYIKGGRIVLTDDFYYVSDADDGTFTLICRSVAESSVSATIPITSTGTQVITWPAFDMLSYNNSTAASSDTSTPDPSTIRQRWANTPSGAAVSTLGCTAPSFTFSTHGLSPASPTLYVYAGTEMIFAGSFTATGLSAGTYNYTVANTISGYGGSLAVSVTLAGDAIAGIPFTWEISGTVTGLLFEGNDMMHFALGADIEAAGTSTTYSVNVTGTYVVVNSLKNSDGS